MFVVEKNLLLNEQKDTILNEVKYDKIKRNDKSNASILYSTNEELRRDAIEMPWMLRDR
jgi:hypothetical protein